MQFVHPDDFWANEAVGDQLNGRHKPEDAIPLFTRPAVAIRPLAAQARNYLGLALRLTGRFDEAFWEFCERIGRTCLLLPSTPEMLKQAGTLIDYAVEQSKNSSLYSYFLFSKGLAAYRAGDRATAITALSAPPSQAYHPARRFVQAMAEYRLGNLDLAHALYAQAAGCDWNQPKTDDHQFWM